MRCVSGVPVAIKAFNVVALKGQSRANRLSRLSKVKNNTPWAKLQREVAILRVLHHPNVVDTVEVVSTDRFLFVVMEWINGSQTMGFNETARRYFSSMAQHDHGSTDFADVLDQPIPEALARQYFRDSLCGLQYVHAQQIVHRDLKPENLLFHRAENGSHTCKIADFGVSSQLQDDERLSDSAGTVHFASPEAHLETADDYSGYTDDVWALGVTLYCFLYQATTLMLLLLPVSLLLLLLLLPVSLRTRVDRGCVCDARLCCGRSYHFWRRVEKGCMKSSAIAQRRGCVIWRIRS